MTEAPWKRGSLFLIDKPAGITSHDVVERVRRAIAIPRVGHSGTLDPMATGLLLLCAAGAARLQSFFTRLDKSYEGVIRLGRATTTFDREGDPVGSDRDPGELPPERIERAADAFRGEFLQAPPPFSAKKVGGRKLYELARKGETVEVPPKKVRVSSLELGRLSDGRLPFAIACTSGTYIRAIASELGKALGCGAHLESLRRSRIGDFHVSDAVALDRFEAMSPGERLEAPHSLALSGVRFPFERVRLASLEVWKVRRGQPIPMRGVVTSEGEWVTLVGPGDEMVALAQVAPIGSRGLTLVRPRIVLQ